MDHSDLTLIESVRLTWNKWPSSRNDLSKIVIPLSAIWTPLQQIPDLPLLPSFPLQCSDCEAILNPFCDVNEETALWRCCFCRQQNIFPPNRCIFLKSGTLPAEAHPSHPTMEYKMPSNNPRLASPFLLIIDLCQSESSLSQLKTAISAVLLDLPKSALVAILSFDSMLYLHELGNQENGKYIPTSVIFRGDKEISPQQLLQQLEFENEKSEENQEKSGENKQGSRVKLRGLRKFFVPVKEGISRIKGVLEGLKARVNSASSSGGDLGETSSRNLVEIPEELGFRATGAALSLASSFLVICAVNSPGRGLLFLAGKCTTGPGQGRTAGRFYDKLGLRLAEHGHSISVFALSALGEEKKDNVTENGGVGGKELLRVLEKTGGTLVVADSFSWPSFQRSLRTFLGIKQEPSDETLGFRQGLKLEIVSGGEIEVSGILGPGIAPLTHRRGRGRRGGNVVERGSSNPPSFYNSSPSLSIRSHTWKIPLASMSTSVAILFDLISPSEDTPSPNLTSFYLQLKTLYLDSQGSLRLRVTTLSRPWINLTLNPGLSPHLTPPNPPNFLPVPQQEVPSSPHFPFSSSPHSPWLEMALEFDPQAALGVLARLLLAKEHDAPPQPPPSAGSSDVSANLHPISLHLPWVEKLILRLCSHWGTFQGYSESSLFLPPQIRDLPVLLFHMARTMTMMTQSSEDERALFHLALNSASLEDLLLILQPRLLTYQPNTPPLLVPLEPSWIVPQRVVMMDCFFLLLVVYDDSLLRSQQEEESTGEYLRKLLEEPLKDAHVLAQYRFPSPRLIICEIHSEEAKLLLSRLNPVHSDAETSGGLEMSFQEFVLRVSRKAINGQ